MGRAVIKLREQAVIDGRLRSKGEVIPATAAQANDLALYDEATIIVSPEAFAAQTAAQQARIEEQQEKAKRKRRKTKFKGRIEQMPDGFIGIWIVAGRTVCVTEETKLSGETPEIGLVAEIDGFDWGNYIEAEKIKVSKPEKVNFSGAIEGLP
jgi:hypothetical protein